MFINKAYREESI